MIKKIIYKNSTKKITTQQRSFVCMLLGCFVIGALICALFSSSGSGNDQTNNQGYNTFISDDSIFLQPYREHFNYFSLYRCPIGTFKDSIEYNADLILQN